MLETINNDLKDAMRSKDSFRLSVLRMLKSAIQTQKISQNKELTDDEIITVIKKQIKMRESSKAEYENYNRLDLAQKLDEEIKILNLYLPKQLEEEQIDVVIQEIFDEVKPTSIKDMRNIMPIATSRLSSCADMSLVSKKIKDKLTSIDT